MQLRLKSIECDKNIMWNEKRMCEECDTAHGSNYRLINNENREENDRS